MAELIGADNGQVFSLDANKVYAENLDRAVQSRELAATNEEKEQFVIAVQKMLMTDSRKQEPVHVITATTHQYNNAG